MTVIGVGTVNRMTRATLIRKLDWALLAEWGDRETAGHDWCLNRALDLFVSIADYNRQNPQKAIAPIDVWGQTTG